MSRILTVTLNPALDLATQTPHVHPDRKLRCAAPRMDPGGGGVNVSRAIARLGGTSLPLVALGGAAGAEYAALLTAEGLTPQALGPSLPTRTNLTVTEGDSGHEYRFVLPGPTWQTQDIDQALSTIRATAQAGDLLVPSGSLPPGVPQDIFLTLNATLSPQGVRMILDTSGPALGAAAHQTTNAPLEVLRMDLHEAETLAARPLPSPADRAAVARDLVLRDVARIVAISGGAQGTVVASDQGAWSCAAPKVPVVSRVGAGDSFVGAMTLALHRGDSAAQACAWGVAAASAAVMTPGTALCDKAQTEACLAQVPITAL